VFNFRRPFGSLAGKLIVVTGVMLFGGSLLVGLLYFKFSENIMVHSLMRHGRASADLVERAIHDGMLNARFDAMQRTLAALANSEDIRDIKVLKKDGTVVFASDPGELGNQVPVTKAFASAARGIESGPEIVAARSGEKLVTVNLPIMNERPCFNAACHVHREDENILGVLQTGFPTTAIEATRERMFQGTLFFGTIVVVLASTMLALILYHFVSKPVAELEGGMKRLARGDFETPIEIHSRDEMGLLAETFNSMAGEVKRYREHMEDWTQSLQDEVDKKTAEIVNAQEQIINAEKLASLGRMAAGVAHELNSPLTGIVTFAHLMRERTAPDKKQDIEDLDTIIEQAERCTKIIKGMLGFARKGASEATETDVNDLLRETVGMVQNQIKVQNIGIEVALGEGLPQIHIDPNQLQQVFLNLITNAVDAMGEHGRISIATRLVGATPEQNVEIEITDTGPGIYPNNLDKIFEPFFTTKPVGKGTGLGLPVSYGIVKKHDGDIVVKSKLGEGTSFFVRLPVPKPEEA